MREEKIPTIELVEKDGEITLYIDGEQAMQAWEKELMWESADILCNYGSVFLEAGLGLGFSALRIAENPNTKKHIVVEKYQKVINLFHQQHSQLPQNLEILQADFFEYVRKAPPESFDGIFFDPALSMEVWNDQPFWDEFIPYIIQVLKPGGAFIPFFSTRPMLRTQYLKFFSRIEIERRPYTAYDETTYTYNDSGDAYIQCFIKTGLRNKNKIKPGNLERYDRMK